MPNFSPVNYRDILYKDYSSHFEKPREVADSVQFDLFETIYPKDSLPSGLIVDLACGRGAWLRWMHKRGAKKLAGVDLSKSDLAVVALPECELLNQDIFQFLEKDPRLFSMIHAKDVIEHFTKDEVVRFLTLCRGRLEPGGILWISTFNALAPLAAQTWRGDFTHEMAFTPGSMKQVLRACGFSESVVTCCHPVPNSAKGWMRSLLLRPVIAACRLAANLRYGFSPDNQCGPSLLAFARKEPVGDNKAAYGSVA